MTEAGILPLSGTEIFTTALPLLDQFRDPEQGQELSELTRKAYEAGRAKAFLTPIVNMAVTAAMRACGQPGVIERLPNEVNDRSETAAYAAIQVAEMGADSGIFVEAYRRDRHLRQILRADPELVRYLEDGFYLSTQCAAPFFETRRVAGGAAHALRRRGINRGITHAITNSKSLVLTATIPKDHSEEVFDYLGSPYASHRRYEVGRVEGRPTIDFSPNTVRYLQQFAIPLRGCPAAAIHLKDGAWGNLLKAGFHNITSFLLQGEAAVTYNR